LRASNRSSSNKDPVVAGLKRKRSTTRARAQAASTSADPRPQVATEIVGGAADEIRYGEFVDFVPINDSALGRSNEYDDDLEHADTLGAVYQVQVTVTLRVRAAAMPKIHGLQQVELEEKFKDLLRTNLTPAVDLQAVQEQNFFFTCDLVSSSPGPQFNEVGGEGENAGGLAMDEINSGFEESVDQDNYNNFS
jgi:hypothetical protein